MVGLIKSEFRKITTTNLWWALLLPIALLSFGAGWLGTYTGALADMQKSAGRPLPVGLLTVSMSTNFSTIFAALFGVLAIAGEVRNQTLTTTYLTGGTRTRVLVAKLVSYTGAGIVYGLANVVFASLGGLLGAGVDGFGYPGDWFAVGGAGLLAMVLWMLLGVGFGALVSSAVVAIMVLLIYKFVIEFVASLYLLTSDMSGVVPYLPGSAGGGIVGNIAVPLFIAAGAGANEQNVPKSAFEVLHFFFGGSYGHPWWASVLTFAGYAAVFLVGGWYVSHRRDIT